MASSSIRGGLLLCVLFLMSLLLVSPCTARLGWWDAGRGLSEEPKLPEVDNSPRESGDDGVPTSSMERGSMYNEWARFTQEATLDYAPPAANPSHY